MGIVESSTRSPVGISEYKESNRSPVEISDTSSLSLLLLLYNIKKMQTDRIEHLT